MQYTLRVNLDLVEDGYEPIAKIEAHINYEYRPARRQRFNDAPEEAEIDVTSIDIVADDGRELNAAVKAWLRGLVRPEDYMERMLNEAEEGRISAAEARQEARRDELMDLMDKVMK